MNDDKEKKDKLGGVKKVLKVTSIIFGIIKFLAGLALIGFFIWLSVQIGAWISTGL